jgi:hypothetical protein
MRQAFGQLVRAAVFSVVTARIALVEGVPARDALEVIAHELEEA